MSFMEDMREMSRDRLVQTFELEEEDKIDLGTTKGRRRFMNELRVIQDPLMMEVPPPAERPRKIRMLHVEARCEALQGAVHRHLSACGKCRCYEEAVPRARGDVRARPRENEDEDDGDDDRARERDNWGLAPSSREPQQARSFARPEPSALLI